MSRPLRIAVARINQESNALSPLRTTFEDFERAHYLEGEALTRALEPAGEEAPGFLKHAELKGFARAAQKRGGVELVPILSAWAVPGGPLTRACHEDLKDRLIRGLQAAGPLDGLLLALHGAMGVEDLPDPEADLLAAVRAATPAPVAVTYDLHANLTREKVAGAELLLAYRTNPHRDHAHVGEHAGRLLLDTIDGKVHPTVAWRSLPMVVGGGTTVDLLPTMRPLFKRMKTLEKNPRVLGCSLFMCHLWNSHPHLGWAVHVITDGDPALAETLADELAERAWAVRTVAPPRFPSIEEAIEKARGARFRRRLGAVCISDTSDVVAAGAPGENPRILKALQAHGQGLLAYVPFRDAVAVDALWHQAEGDAVAFSLGGRLHPALNEPVAITGTLRLKRESVGLGRHVVVATGDIRLVITEGPPIAMKPEFYRDAGLPPGKADIIVVKSFFPWLLYFARYSRMNLWVRTEGITDVDAVRRLHFADQVYPMHDVADWRPTDRSRRAPVDATS